MNDELQRQLAELLKLLIASAQDAAVWAKGEVPVLLWQRIWFGRIRDTVLAVGFAVIAWRAAAIAKRQYAQAMATRSDSRYDVWPERPGGLGSIIAALAAVGAAVGCVINAEWALMAWVAPQLYIVEWLLTLRR